jgi:hypothetical protein
MKKLMAVLIVFTFSINTAFAASHEFKLRDKIREMQKELQIQLDNDKPIKIMNHANGVIKTLKAEKEKGLTKEGLIDTLKDEYKNEDNVEEMDEVIAKIDADPSMKNLQQLISDYQAESVNSDEKFILSIIAYLIVAALLVGIFQMLTNPDAHGINY